MEVIFGLVSRWVGENNSDNSLNFLLFTETSLISEYLRAKTEKSQESQDFELPVPNWKSISRDSWDPKQNNSVKSIFFFPFNIVSNFFSATHGTGNSLLLLN